VSLIKQRAGEARRLLADEVFKAVIQEIRDEATAFFLNANCGIDELADAHMRVRATQIILDSLQARLDAEVVLNKKDQHRAND
jgi:hypothetical protein